MCEEEEEEDKEKLLSSSVLPSFEKSVRESDFVHIS
jgi:hypothetical protein